MTPRTTVSARPSSRVFRAGQIPLLYPRGPGSRSTAVRFGLGPGPLKLQRARRLMEPVGLGSLRRWGRRTVLDTQGPTDVLRPGAPDEQVLAEAQGDTIDASGGHLG